VRAVKFFIGKSSKQYLHMGFLFFQYSSNPGFLVRVLMENAVENLFPRGIPIPLTHTHTHTHTPVSWLFFHSQIPSEYPVFATVLEVGVEGWTCLYGLFCLVLCRMVKNQEKWLIKHKFFTSEFCTSAKRLITPKCPCIFLKQRGLSLSIHVYPPWWTSVPTQWTCISGNILQSLKAFHHKLTQENS